MAGRTTPAAPVLLRAPLSSLSSSCCTPQLTRDRKGFLFWEIATAVAPTTDKRLTIIDPQRVTTASAPLHPETHTPTSPCRQKALVCLQGQACSLTISHEAQRPSGPRATMGVLHHASAYASTPVTATAVTQQQPSPTRHRHTHAHAHTVSRMSHADHALVTHIAPAFPGASSCVLRGHSITQRRYTHPPAGV